MFAQSTKFNRAPPDTHRDRSAPMDFDFEKPRDPGVFGSIPSKRQHIETIDGRSTWTHGPYTDMAAHSAPVIHGGPMLFAQPSPTDLPGKEQDVGDTSMGMDVDTSMRIHEHGDVDMWSDSPAKTARFTDTASRSGEGEKTENRHDATAETATEATPPSILSTILRPINANAVKRVEKQRSRTQQRSLSQGNRTVSSGSAHRGAMVLRSDPEAEELEHSEDGDTDEVSDDEGNIDLTRQGSAIPAVRRRRQRREHSTQSNGNRYTLNLFGGNGQQALGVVPSPSHLEYMQDSKGKINHSEVPYILLGYLQFVFNASIVGVCLYLVLMFIWTIRNDVKERMATYSSEILQEISTCTNLYLVNRCEPSTRIPAMETSCLEWEHCMNRDPTVVGHAKVGAEMFAGVISGFVDELSWKTIFFLLCTMTCFVFITNSALFTIRAKHAQSHNVAGSRPGPSAGHPDSGYMGPRPPQTRDFEWPPLGSSGQGVGARSVSASSDKR
ncbi:hypothetical protein QFC19_001329 [Naganishia cerealis]|uniref:Uncharacterized protein n=1 Tax=Naganishia cerealis TaxID=610337 RepID=A0ACC2WH65_9TREE|nr:hypothetical protein QFC19_001329 [Naganishia cerealis]